MTSYKGEYIWIIGASSGIGAALAKQLSTQGATLALSARREDTLKHLNAALDDKHKVFSLDVTNSAAVMDTAQKIKTSFGRIDRVIFLAAAYKPMDINALDLQMVDQIIDINLRGAFHVIHALMPLFNHQSYGQIALCGSVAGYIGLPGGQPYSATKAAVINLAESLKTQTPDYIDVKLISPGFVKTPMTDKNDFEMPMIISPDQAAIAITKGLKTNGFEIHFPKRLTFLIKILRLLPYWLAFKATQRFNG